MATVKGSSEMKKNMRGRVSAATRNRLTRASLKELRRRVGSIRVLVTAGDDETVVRHDKFTGFASKTRGASAHAR